MKKKHNEGFSLVEVLVAITILALIVIPTCSGIVMALRMNNKADELMQAQLAVSSAVETLMAEGIPSGTESGDYAQGRFADVSVTVTSKSEAIHTSGQNPQVVVEYQYYQVEVSSDVNSTVVVTTNVRAVTPEGGST